MANIIQNATAKTPATAAKQPSVNALMNTFLDGEGMRKRFEDLLGKRTPQFISSIVSLVNANKDLQAAFYESPMTVVQSALKAAMFDLPVDPGLGYAHIVPFKNYKKDIGVKRWEATFILGWKGMNQLALRTGAYKIINVVDVREGELKAFNRLTEEIELSFIEDEAERETKKIIGYVGYYRLVNGAEKTIYMSVKQIENHEKKFRKGPNMGWGWQNDWDAMARKTVFRTLIGKWGVMSIEYQNRASSMSIASQMQEEAAIEESGVLDAEYTDLSVDESTGEVKETPAQ